MEDTRWAITSGAMSALSSVIESLGLMALLMLWIAIDAPISKPIWDLVQHPEPKTLGIICLVFDATASTTIINCNNKSASWGFVNYA